MSAQSFVTSRPVAILMIFLAAVVFGYFSYARLPLALMPELTYPTLTVRTEYEGAAPEEVENDVSRPIEEALGVIGGLQQISSVSRAGVSDVILEFGWDIDIADATQDVLERLDLVFLPSEAKKPLILHFDPALDPVLELSLSGRGVEFEGDEGLRRLRRLADLQVKRVLEPIKGVAAVRIKGGLEEEIQVRLDEEKLHRAGLSISQVISRLAQENINVAGGTIQEGRTEYLVRTVNEFQSLEEIEETIVLRSGDTEIRVRDLGEVKYANKERQIVTRTDGAPSVQIEIYKEADANIVSLAKAIKATLGDFTPPAILSESSSGDTAEARRDSSQEEAARKDASSADSGDEGERRGHGNRRGGRGGRGGGIGGGGPQGLTEQLYRSEGASLRLVADRSLFIESSIAEVRNTALLGGLLAVVVLFVFLRNAVSTAIIAVSIPISLLVTFAPLNLIGVSLNIMSLGGLALGIGMLVDSSIVVLESIQRCRDEGDGVVSAAIRGTNEVRAAVVASILTSIAVFFPMVFVEGVAGQAFGDLGLAVVVSLLASLVVAIYFIPMLASRRVNAFEGPASDRAAGEDRSTSGPASAHSPTSSSSAPSTRKAGGLAFLRRGVGFRFASWDALRRDLPRIPRWARVSVVPAVIAVLYIAVIRFVIATALELVGKILILVLGLLTFLTVRVVWPALRIVFGVLGALPLRLTDKLLASLNDGYPRVIRHLLTRPGLTGGILLVTLIGMMVMVRGLASELLPEVRQGEFTVEVALPVGTPLEETERVLAPVEAALLAERDDIHALILTVGFDPSQSERSDEGEHTARIKVLLEKGGRNAEREDAVAARIRTRLDRIPDLDATITRPVLFSSKTPIEVEIHGDDLGELRTYSEETTRVLSALPELADVQSTLRPGAPEVQIVYDRERLSRFGLSIGEVARLVRDKVQGNEATRFNRVNRRIPILVQLEEEDREAVEDVEDVIVNPGGDRPIPLSAVADVVLGEGPSEVRRIDGGRVAVVRANLAEGSLSTATDAIRSALDREIDWPAGLGYLMGGQNQEWERSRGSLLLALGLSVFLVYVIMAAQFESLLHPFLIMFTIPLAFVGTFIALHLLGIPLSVVVFLGMILLAGIVVNNAIVLVDYINTLRRRGIALEEAIVTAGRVRLRPILMTTLTTVLGLLPMAVGLGDGAEIRTPMAIAVITGLLSSTFLTLLIIPSLYGMLERAKDRIRANVLSGSSVRADGHAGPSETNG